VWLRPAARSHAHDVELEGKAVSERGGCGRRWVRRGPSLGDHLLVGGVAPGLLRSRAGVVKSPDVGSVHFGTASPPPRLDVDSPRWPTRPSSRCASRRTRLNRRTFIGTLVGGLLAAPLAAAAQPVGKVLPRVGFLGNADLETETGQLEAFRQGLRELGWLEGQTITIDYRWAGGHAERVPELAAALARKAVITSPAIARRRAGLSPFFAATPGGSACPG
jgi:hypothetical protein